MVKSLVKNSLSDNGYRKFVGFIRDYLYGWHSRYYAEYGEDSIVNCLAHYKRDGFYIDVGAFHPKRLSSTYYFYKRQNWSGLIIEPNPENAKLFSHKRGRDSVLNLGVAKENDNLSYYMFEDASQNTFSPEFRDDRIDEGMKVIDTKVIPVEPLSSILDKNIKDGQVIDYLNVDVEGLDLAVLESNDWARFRPRIITVEDISFDIENPTKNEIYNFLKNKGYSLKAVSYITLIFSIDE